MTQQLDLLPVAAPAPQCGQCINYQADRTHNGTLIWGHCTLRAAADIHPCNLPPWDTYAEQCHWYEQEVPF